MITSYLLEEFYIELAGTTLHLEQFSNLVLVRIEEIWRALCSKLKIFIMLMKHDCLSHCSIEAFKSGLRRIKNGIKKR